MKQAITVFFAYQFVSSFISKSDRDDAITLAVSQASTELQLSYPDFEIKHRECHLKAGHFVGSQILELLSTSDILVADISEANANVMFELGYLCGFQAGTERRTLCIAHESVDLKNVPSDIRGLYIEPYSSAGLATLLAKIILEAALEIVAAQNLGEDISAIQSFWGLRHKAVVDIVCSEIPVDERPYFASPEDRNYLRYAKFADLDTLIFLRSRIPQVAPSAIVRDFSPSEYFDTHCDSLIVVGGPPWNGVFRRYQGGLPFHFIARPLGQDDPLCIELLAGRELCPTWASADTLRCDVSLVSRLLVNDTQVFLIGGCLTWGVLGAAEALLDGRRGAQNIKFLNSLVGESDFIAVFESEKVGNQVKTVDLAVQRPLIVLSRTRSERDFQVALDRP